MSRRQRFPVRLTKILAQTVCAWLVAYGVGSGDTLRTELYRFEVPSLKVAEVDRIAAESSVHVRVSNVETLGRHLDNSSASSHGKGTKEFALFEFFLAGETRGLSLHRVSFRDSHRSRLDALGKLRCILTADRSVGHASLGCACPEEAFVGATHELPQRCGAGHCSATGLGVTIDLAVTGKGRGLCAGDMVGLVFELARGETIDTLIDDRLTPGDLQVEVELETAGGAKFSASLSRLVSVFARESVPADKLGSAPRCPAASRGPWSSPPVSHNWSQLILPSESHRPSAYDLARKVITLVPSGLRAREPPQWTVNLL